MILNTYFLKKFPKTNKNTPLKNKENLQKLEYDNEINKSISSKKFVNKFEEDYFTQEKKEKEKTEKEKQMKFKTELCNFYEINGRCKFGEACIFAHGKENLRENQCKKSGYKKRLCVNFFDKGLCMYGNRCQFSHNLNKFEKEKKDNEKNNFSYKNFFLDLNYKIAIDIRKELKKIKGRPRLSVFKKIVKVKKIIYKKSNNYVDDIIKKKKEKK
jgi:hypothetical protein